MSNWRNVIIILIPNSNLLSHKNKNNDIHDINIIPSGEKGRLYFPFNILSYFMNGDSVGSSIIFYRVADIALRALNTVIKRRT